MKENKQTAFSVFFTQLHKLLPAGMLFSVLAVIFMTLTIGLSAILAQSTGIKGFNSIFIWALGLIPTTICYSGLVKVVRKYAVEKEFVPVFPLYLMTVGDNIKGFLLLGIFVYLISCCSFYSLLFYFSMLRANRAFGIALTAYSFFTLMMIVSMMMTKKQPIMPRCSPILAKTKSVCLPVKTVARWSASAPLMRPAIRE